MVKRFSVWLLLTLVVTSPAQESRIIDLGDGLLSWTNSQTNVYYAVEWTWNLQYNSIHMESNLRVTQAVMRADMGDMRGLLHNVMAFAEAFDDTPHGVFFRIHVSPDPIPATSPTNWLRVVNASTSSLENLVFGVERHGWPHQSVEVPMLSPQSNTAFHACSLPWPHTGPNWWEPNGYFINYTQGSRDLSFSADFFAPIGPPRKDVTITVSNSSYTVGLDWLPFRRTIAY